MFCSAYNIGKTSGLIESAVRPEAREPALSGLPLVLEFNRPRRRPRKWPKSEDDDEVEDEDDFSAPNYPV